MRTAPLSRGAVYRTFWSRDLRHLLTRAEVHGVHSSLQIAVRQMRVTHGHAVVFMPEQRLEPPPLDAVHGLITGERVAEIMEPTVFDSRPLEGAPKRHRDLVGPEREQPLTIKPGRQRAQRLEGCIIQIDVASLAVLGRFELLPAH